MYGGQVRSEEIEEQSTELSKAKNCMTKLIKGKEYTIILLCSKTCRNIHRRIITCERQC